MDKREERAELEDESHKRKSKSPSLKEHEPKRARADHDEGESSEDIAKQYKRFVAAPRFSLNSEELYCVCRKPDTGGDMMISCDGCEEWFHVRCMKIDTRDVPLLDKFFCRFCQWRGVGATRWNHKCREPSCFRSVRKHERSKYCSAECGHRFLRDRLAGAAKLTRGEVRFVVDFCATYQDLRDLGTHFPELPEVSALDTAKLPESVCVQLRANDQRSQHVQAQLALAELRSQYLLQIKELWKVVNERIQERQDPEEAASDKKSRKKKPKAKKVDLCCYSAALLVELPADAYQAAVDAPSAYAAFQAEIDSAVDGYANDAAAGVCLEDRRKCLRHNGWLNLHFDQSWKQQVELKAVLDKLAHKRAAILRDYSVSVYDRAAQNIH